MPDLLPQRRQLRRSLYRWVCRTDSSLKGQSTRPSPFRALPGWFYRHDIARGDQNRVRYRGKEISTGGWDRLEPSTRRGTLAQGRKEREVPVIVMSIKQPRTTQEPATIIQRRSQGEARRTARTAYPYPGCCICDNRHVELAHLDHNPSNNDPDNLAWLCPTDHFRFDRGLIPSTALNSFGHISSV